MDRKLFVYVLAELGGARLFNPFPEPGLRVDLLICGTI